MKRIFVPLLILAFLSCNKVDETTISASCPESKIQHFSKSEINCPDARVDKYIYQNAIVYVFEHGTCIYSPSEVTDDKCQTLGHVIGSPGGTFTNGESFSNAVYVETVWMR